ncbi:MAG TPA: ABC-F family ATP-binding cassette domain-containing protein [Chloroflexota bacterium]|nr:ABC-F family ATP-binding cassette domain-containing protein [Chloroflexota bacterium]
MSLILVENVTVRLGDRKDRVVLRDVYFRLVAGERVGLIGKNGAGKTTLLRLILGQLAPDAGTVTLALGTRVGYFSQFSELVGDRTVVEELEEVFAGVRALQEELETVGARLGDPAVGGKEQATLLERHDALAQEIEHRGGWTYQTEIDTVLSKLGFDGPNAALRQRPVERLSGGWRNRASLAKLLLERPDVLLLDEPTNFLDVEGVSWLEGWLSKHRGATIVVSHDRHFLDRVATRVVEVESHHLQEYEGSYSNYVRLKPLRLKTLERQFEHEAELLAYEQEAIARRREDARDPSNALKRRLANIKKQTEPRPVDAIITGLYSLLSVPTRLCLVEELCKGYDAQRLFGPLTFEIAKGDRVAVVGPNGIGKSTLLRVMAQDEPPDSGRVVWHHGVRFVSFNEVLAELPPDASVTKHINTLPMVLNASLSGQLRSGRRQVNRFLSLMRFTEAEQMQRIGTLSGGLKARVALVQCLLSGAQVLLLDEPTNHLDLTTIQVMERALAHFPGGIVVVSHDRFFIDTVATRLLVFEGAGRTRLVEGTWTTWHAQQAARPVQSAPPRPAP